MATRIRKNFFVASGVIAALLAVGFFAFNPKFPPEQSSGAIGVVEKHHATQITESSVVLGDESVKHDNRIAFGDYLSDAAKLRSISQQIGSRDQLQSAIAGLQGHRAEVGSRYLTGMKDTLGSISTLLAKSNIGNKQELEAAVKALESSIANKEQLNAAEIANINAQLESFVNRLENSGDMLQGSYYYGGGTENGSFSQLEAKASELGSKSSIGSREVLGMTANLQSVAKDLGARGQVGSGIMFNSRLEHLGAMAVESKTLDAAISQLGSRNPDLGAISSQLGTQVNNLEAKALNNMEANLASQNQLASRLGSMDRALGSLQQLGSKAQGVDSRTLEAFNQALGSVTSALQSREAQFESRAQGSMQAQLGAVSSYLGTQQRLGARDASLGAFQNYLGNLSQSLENKSNGIGSRANLGSKDQLASQSRDLANIAAGLQSKNAE